MKIVVAIDGSPMATRALLTVFALAKAMRETPEVHLVSVVDYIEPPMGLGKTPLDAPDLLLDEAQTALQIAQEIAAKKDVPVQSHVLRGHVSVQVLEYARTIGATLIASGTHGRKGIARAILGSTCERLVRQSEIPVLTVRGESMT